MYARYKHRPRVVQSIMRQNESGRLVVFTSNMSTEYFSKLVSEDKKHYSKKLTLANGTLLRDPFSLKGEDWSDDVSLLPDVTHMDLYVYLIHTPSEFTNESLKAYKSLEAYNFYLSGHVQDVYCHLLKDVEFCYIKSSVLPSQRQGQKQKLYDVWIILHTSGWVLSANCTCVAGLGSACSHVAALLFKLVACATLELNKKACTSKLCSWKKSRKRAHPAPLKHINFKRPKKSEVLPTIDEPFEGELKGFTSVDPLKFVTEEEKQQWISLSQIAPDAVVLKNISLDLGETTHHDDSETETADENEKNILPEPLTYIYDSAAINKNEIEINNIAQKNYNQYKSSCFDMQFENLKKFTEAQSLSDKWMLHRAGRITASVSKLAFTSDLKKTKTLIETIMQYKEPVDVVATRYGKRMENRARSVYEQHVKQHHVDLQVVTTGLHIDPNFPYLAASPDGLVKCKCHGQSLVEIKCPFKYKKSLKLWRNDKNCPIDKAGKFKKNHAYYFQVQHQMLVTKMNYCDFFVFSQGKQENDTFLIRVTKNEPFCRKLREKLAIVFEKVLLPELVTRKSDPKLLNEEKVYCICRRPSFPPMIGCDNLGSCDIEWFHYSCVKITRAPKTWLCSTCQNNIKKK
ncbi:uncharacterized protein LOC130625692 [Hydractinia symbiolongicarpus]|uniref:uncharacterized protein LOC130625692 n=1 Tax=Hydractinia symbiolongicarpus TaxID=13093 RepID=UPI002550C3E8|nr:uncharacterized protein LOC130625692 [Hydractinia symbiolongicarpus]